MGKWQTAQSTTEVDPFSTALHKTRIFNGLKSPAAPRTRETFVSGNM